MFLSTVDLPHTVSSTSNQSHYLSRRGRETPAGLLARGHSPLPAPASDVGSWTAPEACGTASVPGVTSAFLCGRYCLNKRKRLCNCSKMGLSQL